ncbi:hypothetical protein [Leptospira borgpetersenii]|uniref:hypothetical protein n=1 Tax=Leptospira borgpetersenii TaxID=174 RepID=UPI000ABC7B68
MQSKEIRSFLFSPIRASIHKIRQNGAPSGLEKRELDASIYHKTKKPTEGTQ